MIICIHFWSLVYHLEDLHLNNNKKTIHFVALMGYVKAVSGL